MGKLAMQQWQKNHIEKFERYLGRKLSEDEVRNEIVFDAGCIQHATKQIEVRDRTFRGDPLATLTNATTLGEVHQIMESLSTAAAK